MTDERDNRADDARAIAEAVVEMLAERGLVVCREPGLSARVLNVREVAHLLGRSAPWVYEHATELGAIRMGDGPKARIGFDLARIEAWKRDHQAQPPQAISRARRRPRRDTASPAAGLIPYEPSTYRL